MSKMNFRNIPYLFFLACAILMISCSQPQPFIFKGLKSIKIEKASLGKNVFNAEFTYENPNSFSLALNIAEHPVPDSITPTTSIFIQIVLVRC